MRLLPPSLGVIGFGRIAQAVLSPLLNGESSRYSDILAVVGHEKSVQKLYGKFPDSLTLVAATDQRSKEVWKCPFQILAVKPQQLDDVVTQARQNSFSKESFTPVLISVMAGVSIDRLSNLFPDYICVRAVPNAPCSVGSGLTALVWCEDVTNEQKVIVRDIFHPVSEVFELPEKHIDAFLALTSSGPAYIAVVVEALADGAVAAGLPRDLALDLAKSTVAGTADLLIENNMHPAYLKEMVASPGGTTMAALRHLEKAKIRSALIEAVIVAAEKSKELA